MTVAENRRLQSIPDWVIVSGGTTAALRQIGNGVGLGPGRRARGDGQALLHVTPPLATPSCPSW